VRRQASVYVALCRATGIPARLSPPTSRTTSPRRGCSKPSRADLFAYHGYVEISSVRLARRRDLQRQPVRDCVPPLEFTGEADALLQPFDARGASS
jgi:hypothetical protein